MSKTISAFLVGIRDISPILLGVMPFGLICGAVSVGVGMSEMQALGMSAIIFAGASQLAAIQLMTEHASVAVVILTGLVINARHLMYSASLAPHFKGMNPLSKAGLAFILTDQSFAVSINRFNEPDSGSLNKAAYFLGGAVLMFFAFNVATLIGAYLGNLIPPGWDLDFAVPLTFAALTIPAVKDRPSFLAAVVAGVVALVADPMPYNLGLITSAATGIISGYLLERRKING